MLWERSDKKLSMCSDHKEEEWGDSVPVTSMLRLSDSGAGEATAAWAVGTTDDKHTTNFYPKYSLVVSA